MGDEADSQQEYLDERFKQFGETVDISNSIVHQDYIRWLAYEYYSMRPIDEVMKEGLVKFDKDKIRKQRGERLKLQGQKQKMGEADDSEQEDCFIF